MEKREINGEKRKWTKNNNLHTKIVKRDKKIKKEISKMENRDNETTERDESRV